MSQEVSVDRYKVVVVGAEAFVCKQVVLDLTEVRCLVVVFYGT